MITQEHLNRFDVLRTHPTEENPFIVDSYPYGFKKTKAKYWIESKKGNGDRLVFQTLNPKTQKWNKPKKSTYSKVIICGIDKENGHFKQIGHLSHYSREEFNKDYDFIKDLVDFNEIQQANIKDLIAFHKVMENVKFEIRRAQFRHKETGEIVESVPLMQISQYEEVTEEEINKEQEEIKNRIGQSIAYERSKL